MDALTTTTGVIRHFFLVLCVHYVYISGMINTEKRIKDAIKYAKLHPVKKMQTVEYKGQTIKGKSGRWFLDCHPSVFSSKKLAMEAVDKMIEMRMLTNEKE